VDLLRRLVSKIEIPCDLQVTVLDILCNLSTYNVMINSLIEVGISFALVRLFSSKSKILNSGFDCIFRSLRLLRQLDKPTFERMFSSNGLVPLLFQCFQSKSIIFIELLWEFREFLSLTSSVESQQIVSLLLQESIGDTPVTCWNQISDIMEAFSIEVIRETDLINRLIQLLGSHSDPKFLDVLRNLHLIHQDSIRDLFDATHLLTVVSSLLLNPSFSKHDKLCDLLLTLMSVPTNRQLIIDANLFSSLIAKEKSALFSLKMVHIIAKCLEDKDSMFLNHLVDSGVCQFLLRSPVNFRDITFMKALMDYDRRYFEMVEAMELPEALRADLLSSTLTKTKKRKL
jgi:hypothetical protein